METVFINVLKSSCLIAIFYIAYIFLLRKETFFNANRWFLLLGLLTSVILPWIVFTTVVWVEPSPAMEWTNIPIPKSVQPQVEINWNYILLLSYGIVTLVLSIQFILDYWNLKRIINSKTTFNQADHKFIDHHDSIAPFSYFKTIVYNSSLYSEQELESILEHEKVHSEQYHTVDVLIARLYCILFWFNPFIWLYKQAILQNLEFIADHEASKNISDLKAYQITLLKITTHQNYVSLTNHFYQSLIKKRIVMLNKNQSKKWNSLKYALMIPVLGAFIFFYQIEVIAKEKQQEIVIQKITTDDVEIYNIDKNSTEADLKEKVETIKKLHGLEVRFSKTKRNANNELTAISVTIKKGKEISENRAVKSNDPIKPFAIVISKDDTGKLNISFNERKNKDAKIARSKTIYMTKSSPSTDNLIIEEDDNAELKEPLESVEADINKIEGKKVIRVITRNTGNGQTETEYYINGEKLDKEAFDKETSHSISKLSITNDGKKTIKIISSDKLDLNFDKDAPQPPSPPAPPTINKIKTPAPPVLPAAPKAPKGDPLHGDKKAWEDYEKQIEDYKSKMELKAYKLENYRKQMADFEKQMEPYQKEMQAYQEKMRAYAKEMKKYMLEKNLLPAEQDKI